jgi:hypothetical protein
MRFKNTGVTYYEIDRECTGPFRIRVGGTNEFVSMIDPNCPRSWPPGRVELVEGWDNDKALDYQTLDEAITAAVKVWDIEGFHTTIEAMHAS